MERDVPLMEGEIYHVYNRGAHKQAIFLGDYDYVRFQILLLLSNSKKSFQLANLLKKYQGPTLITLFEQKIPENRMVDVLAYSLMPNHFHLALRQLVPDGITLFMRKLCTGYSMYFNKRHEHSGTLFQGKFKSSHVDSDGYLDWLMAYIHLNPVELIEPEWGERIVSNARRAQEFLNGYEYSSYWDYTDSSRPQRSILQIETARAGVGDINALLESYSRFDPSYPQEVAAM